ncbi:polysaccharide lyase [Rheinheimera gaetbuli]
MTLLKKHLTLALLLILTSYSQKAIAVKTYSPSEILNTLKEKSNVEIDENSITVYYQPNDIGSERVISNLKTPYKTESGTLYYTIKFCDNFDFGRGGKLPGIGSEKPTTGGNKRQKDQWSVRLMFGGSGQLIIYKYTQKNGQKYGESTKTEFTMQKNREYRIELSVTLNLERTPGKILLKVNEKKILDETGIKFREIYNDNSKISTVLFQTFHGGSDKSWTPNQKDKENKICANFSEIGFN